MGNKHSGPRPLSAELKRLKGITRKDRLNDREPQPPAGPVTKPGTLSASGAAVWDEIAPLCVAMGTLTVVDVPAFETFCELKASSRALSVGKGKRGWPHARAERDAAHALKSYYDYFGMTPSSRSRIKVSTVAAAPNKWQHVA